MEPRLLKVEPLPDFNIKLYYETGEVKVYDVKPYISAGPWTARLGNESYFARVRVVDSGWTVEWPEGHDIAPHELYELGVTVDPVLARPN